MINQTAGLFSNASEKLDGQDQNSVQKGQTNISLGQKVTELATQADAQIKQKQSLGIPISDQQWNLISRSAASSEKPNDEMQRYAAAITYSREYGVDISMALENLDQFNQYQLGTPYSPTPSNTQAIANSLKVGKMGIPYAELALQFKTAHLSGQDTSGIEAQLQAMKSEIDKYQDVIPRNLGISMLKNLAYSVPYTFDVASHSLAGGTASALALATIVAASGLTFATDGIAAPLAASVIPASLATVYAGASTAFTFQRSKDLREGVAYYDMISNGADKDIAKNLSMIDGMITGAVESVFDQVGGYVLKGAGKTNAAGAITSKVMGKLVSNGTMGTIAKGLAEQLANATGEGIQEFTESMADQITEQIAYSMSDVAPPKKSTPIIKQALREGIGGFQVGLLMGALPGSFNTALDIKEMINVRNAAASTPSKEAFVSAMKESRPESVTPADWATAMNTVWTKEHAGKPISTAIQSEEAAVNELDAGKGKTPSGVVRRLGTGEIFTQEGDNITTDTEGTEHHQLKVGDPVNGKRYGTIDYSINGNTLTVEDVKVRSGYETIRKESLLSLAKQYPGYDIQWEAKGENLQSIKNEIIESNPRGKEAGLQYYDGITNVDERIALEDTIGDNFPNLNASERSAAAILLQLRAEAKGMTSDNYIKSVSKNGSLFSSLSTEQLGNAKAKGASSFDQDARAVIYAAENADFSTFAHEVFHVVRREMEQTAQLEQALSEAAKTPEFVQYISQHKDVFGGSTFDGKSTEEIASLVSEFGKDWTRGQEELAARLWESYLKDGKTSSKKLEGIFRRISEWMGKIYKALKGSVALDKRISDVFDSLLDADTPLARAARETQGASKQGAEQVAQESVLFQGYDYSKNMSNNAIDAYNEGKRPLHKWTKADILSGIQKYSSIDLTQVSAKDLKDSFLVTHEWHHTGSNYKKTDFYEISEDAIRAYIAGERGTALQLEREALGNYNIYTKIVANVMSDTGLSMDEAKEFIHQEYESAMQSNPDKLVDIGGTYFSKDSSLEQIDTVSGESINFFNFGNGEDSSWRNDPLVLEGNILFQEAPADYQPKKTGIGYKVFYKKNGNLYPPMVANPEGEGTPVGVWLLADAAPIAGYTKTGRPQVKSGGKGTQGKSGLLAYRPGWHLGEIPYAKQFNRLNPETGQKELFPKDFVWAEVEYSMDNDYNEEALNNGHTKNGGFSHALASLDRMPEDGFYNYRTNPDPTTDPWVITGAMKVNKVLTREEVDQIVRDAGREPQRVEGDVLFQEDAQRQYDAVVSELRGTDQWMKAPNGQPTNLTERQWVQVRTSSFKRWFGNWENDPENASKVLDKNGEPLEVFHGTDKDIDRFDSFNGMTYFTDDPRYARGYAFQTDSGREYARAYKEKRYAERHLTKDHKGMPMEFDMDHVYAIPDDYDGDGGEYIAASYDSVYYIPADNSRNWKLVTGFHTELDRENGKLRVLDGAGDDEQGYLDTIKQAGEKMKSTHQPVIYRQFLNIRKPFYEDSAFKANKYAASGGFSGEKLDSVMARVDQLKADGYDGIIAESDSAVVNQDIGEEDPDAKVTDYIILDPSQAANSTTNTQYSAIDDSVLFQEAPAIDTPAFKTWFGDSKIVDSNNDPLVVYHATDDKFTSFDMRKLGMNTKLNTNDTEAKNMAELGILTSRDPVNKKTFQDISMELYERIENPLKLSFNELWSRAAEFESGEDMRISFEDDGYDGLIIQDSEFNTTSYVAFSPTQVKSINNKGTWSNNNPNILFQEEQIESDGFKITKTDQFGKTRIHIEDQNGYATLSEAEEESYDNDGNDTSTPYILLEEISVTKNHRQGNGRRLLRKALDIADKTGLPVKLSANADISVISEEDLVKFYESEGFSIVDADGVVAMERPASKGNGRLGEDLFGNRGMLFQEADIDHDQILEDARQSDTWQDFRDFYKAFADPSDESIPSDDTWYRETFNEAHGISNDITPGEEPQTTRTKLETEQQKDDYFRDRMSTDDGISAFIEKLGWALTTNDYEHVGPGDQAEADYVDKIYEMRLTLPDEVHPTVLANAYRMSGGKKLNPKSIKSLRTLMTGNAVRYYRDIYADLTEDNDLKPQVIDERLPKIDEPGFEELENLSITQRVNLAKDIEGADLKKKIMSGKETMDGDAEKVIAMMDREISTLNKKITKAEAEIEMANADLTDTERTLAVLYANEEETRRMLDKENREIRKKTDENFRISESELRNTYTLQSKLDKLHEQIIKQRASERVKATVKRHEALSDLKDQLREKQKAKDDARKVREYKQKLARMVMVKPSDAIDYEYAQRIYNLQATLDPKFRQVSVEIEGERVTIEEARQIMDGVSDEEIREALGDRLFARIKNERKPLNDWTVEEMEQLAETIANLRSTGRQVLEAKNEQKRIVAESYQNAIIRTLLQTGKYVPRPIYGSQEEMKQRKNSKDKFRAFKYVALPMRVKAMMLDGDTQGSAYDLLVTQKRNQQIVEWTNIEKRQKPIFDILKKLDMTETDLYQTVPVTLDGKTQHMTYSTLMYAWLSQFEESNRQAVSYGTLVTVDDKIQLNHDNELIRNMGDARYKQLLDHAQHYLVNMDESGRYMALVKAIRDDFNGQADRINEIAIREYNQPMRSVDEYLPIHRKEMTGNDLKQNVADDWFNANAGGMATSVSKGFTKDRINISPDHQGNTDMDLMNVWDRSVRQQEHMIAFAEYGRKLNRVFKNLGSREMQNFINQTYGTAMMDDINDYIDEVINPQSFERKKGAEKLVKTMRGNLGAAYLAWKTSGLILQAITSPMPFLSDVKPANLIQGYFDISMHPHKVWQFVQEKSQMMKNRSPNIIIDQILQESKTYTDSKLKRFNTKQQEIGTMGLTLVDRWAVAGGWLAAYRQKSAELEAKGFVSSDADAQAVVYADDVVLRTQPTGDKTELAPLFKSGGEFGRVFTQFQSALNVIWANTTYDVPHMFMDSMDKTIPDAVRKVQFERAVGQVTGYLLAGALLGAVAEGHGKDDDDKDKVRNYVYWSLTQFADSAPLIGNGIDEIVKSLVTGEKPEFYGSDIFPAMSNILDGAVDITQGDWMTALKNMGEGFGYATGAPVSGAKQLKRAIEEGPGAFLGRRK